MSDSTTPPRPEAAEVTVTILNEVGLGWAVRLKESRPYYETVLACIDSYTAQVRQQERAACAAVCEEIASTLDVVEHEADRAAYTNIAAILRQRRSG